MFADDFIKVSNGLVVLIQTGIVSSSRKKRFGRVRFMFELSSILSLNQFPIVCAYIGFIAHLFRTLGSDAIGVRTPSTKKRLSSGFRVLSSL